jgi:hypothetical protein
MRLLKWGVILCGVAVAGWSGWWYLGALGQEEGLETWLEQQRKRGWQAEARTVEVQGYPLDFRTEARDLALADPRNGWSWTAPLLIAESKAHQPTRIAVTWPGEQVLAVPGDRADIRSEAMMTLVDLRPGPSMELRQVTGEIQTLAILGQSGWKAGADSVALNLGERPEDLGPAHAYDLELTGVKIRLPKALVAKIDPTGWLKPSVDTLTVRAHAALDDPLNRLTVEQGRLAMRAATIREAGFEWGEMRLVVKGAFEVDDSGFPDGDIRIEAREWRQMIRLAVTSGMIDAETGASVTQAVQFVTALTGTGENLSIPLGLGGGKVRIGPFAIADAPRLAPPR